MNPAVKAFHAGIDEKTQVCANCTHFVQHFMYDPKLGYTLMHMGHCVYPRMKERKAYDDCKHFENRHERRK